MREGENVQDSGLYSNVMETTEGAWSRELRLKIKNCDTIASGLVLEYMCRL